MLKGILAIFVALSMLVTFAWICVAIVAATTDIIRFLCKRVLRSRNISNEPLDDS